MEDAAARKERLRALRQAAEQAEQATGDAQAEPEKPVLRFRNYAVKDHKHIQHEQVQPAQPPKLEEPQVTKKPEEAAQEDLLVNVAPKKANWDLKRDVQAQLDKLERRTQRAIIEIMREQESQQSAGRDVGAAGVGGEVQRQCQAGTDMRWQDKYGNTCDKQGQSTGGRHQLSAGLAVEEGPAQCVLGRYFRWAMHSRQGCVPHVRSTGQTHAHLTCGNIHRLGRRFTEY
ncbi:uncharacterized protein HaLaN_27613 [Haematococcus lacustris]|uniref:Coiled-coil domain-containing protein 12 n=1 Tax=Haematococcus lacustris TaxID=44745 RepID=A0A6A0AA95_HAELA|nr:uncharacterized protein HaLaN_27613 [Haematococcus lacustris]